MASLDLRKIAAPYRTFFVRSGNTLPYAVGAKTVESVLPQAQP